MGISDWHDFKKKATGLGISNIYDKVMKFTNKPITAVATHIHWDHIGGRQYFPVCATAPAGHRAAILFNRDF